MQLPKYKRKRKLLVKPTFDYEVFDCGRCKQPAQNSFLKRNFSVDVCDDCRDDDIDKVLNPKLK